MIPAHGYVALYGHPRRPGTSHRDRMIENRPVIAWGPAGEAMVVGKKGLIPADELVLSDSRRFLGLTDMNFDPDRPALAFLPADGWEVVWSDGDTTPVVGFKATHNDCVFPLIVMDDGSIEPVSHHDTVRRAE